MIFQYPCTKTLQKYIVKILIIYVCFVPACALLMSNVIKPISLSKQEGAFSGGYREITNQQI